MIQTLSFFTIQRNVLVLIVAVTLVVNPDRDGRIWRVLRLDALLGITITGLVFDLILIHYVHPSGWQLVATIGYAAALRNTAFVMVVALVLVVIFARIDQIRTIGQARRPQQKI